jgi:hypothetical protein
VPQTFKVVWAPGPELIAANIAAVGPLVEAKLGPIFASAAAEAEALAKSSAPWSDRTGAARGSLNGSSTVGGGRATMTLAHGVYYGIYLELANQGRYAVVLPTMRQMVTSISQKLSGLL